MNRYRALFGRLDRIQQRSQGDRIEVIGHDQPETEFSGACELAVTRNGEVVFHFPRKLAIEDWLARFAPGQPTAVAMACSADDLPGTRPLSACTLVRVK
ncbi:MAG TPA: hypothetical protein VHR86_08810 [Armatimonadota bacterium]|nr:hypothetical protein [Armatimonadota bacterium]